MEEGRVEGLQEAITTLLKLKLGPDAAKLVPKVQALRDLKRLRAVVRGLKSAGTVAEVKSLLRSPSR